MIVTEQDNSSGKYDATKINASPLVRMCITKGAMYKEEDGKCGLIPISYILIGQEKELLACSYRSETGTCHLNKEKMSQKEIDDLVQMVLEDRQNRR